MKKPTIIIIVILIIVLTCICCCIGGFVLIRNRVAEDLAAPRNPSTVTKLTKEQVSQFEDNFAFDFPESLTNMTYVDDGGIDPMIYMVFEIDTTDASSLIKANNLVESSENSRNTFLNSAGAVVKRYSWWNPSTYYTDGQLYAQNNTKYASFSVYMVSLPLNKTRIFINAWDT